MADRIIEIIIETNDRTGGSLGAVQNKLLAFDKAVQKTQNRLKSMSTNAYEATIRLVDRVTPQGSKINSFLKSVSSKMYNATVGLIDKTTGGIRNLEAKLMQLTGKAYNVTVGIKDQVSKGVKGIADSALMQATGVGLQMAGAAGIGMGAVSAVNTYKDFEYQMATVRALTTTGMDKSVADEQMDKLTQKAKELGATTQFTASEVGKAFEYMGLAGWKGEQMLSGVPALLNLSAAAGEDLGRVADIVTDSMTGMHMQAGTMVKDGMGNTVEASQHFADVMAAMVTNSNTTVGMAGEAFKYAAPIAGSLGYSIDDVALMTGLMANAGIKGSQAGTSMRSTFTRMATDQQTAALAKNMLGVSTTNEDGSMRGLRDVLLDLRGKFQEGIDNDKLVDFIAHAGDIKNVRNKDKIVDMMKQMKENGGKMSESDKVKFANMLAGQEAMSGLLAAITASDEDFNKLTNAIDNSAGAAEKMAKIKMDTLEGDVKTLGSAWEG